MQIAIVVLAVSASGFAEDSHFPREGQQIPLPECLTMKGLWEGGSKACGQNEHKVWLANITYW